MNHQSFYKRPEWLRIRWRVLHKYGFKCMACSRTAKDGVVIHVDHIKPISIFPELALTEENLQVLCDQCNQGKSNKCATDFRPVIEKRAVQPQAPRPAWLIEMLGPEEAPSG